MLWQLLLLLPMVGNRTVVLENAKANIPMGVDSQVTDDMPPAFITKTGRRQLQNLKKTLHCRTKSLGWSFILGAVTCRSVVLLNIVWPCTKGWLSHGHRRKLPQSLKMFVEFAAKHFHWLKTNTIFCYAMIHLSVQIIHLLWRVLQDQWANKPACLSCPGLEVLNKIVVNL